MINPRMGRLVTRYSSRGTPFQVWEKPVPRISDDFIDCCIYLYASQSDAEAGQKTGGSGFLVGVPTTKIKNGHWIYAVTNRHVIEKGNTVVRFNTVDGKTDTFDLNEQSWHFHHDGDDLAICGLSSIDSKIYRAKFVTAQDHFITKDLVHELNVGPGDDVFVVGRFINQEGRQCNSPSARFGNIAQMPPEPIRLSRGTGFFEQESFVVEAKSIGGYSGSPVFVGFNPLLERPERPGKATNRAYLLGVCWGYINDWTPLCDANGEPLPSGYQVRSNTGMMSVVPAWKLHEMLYHPQWEEFRMSNEDRLLKERLEAGVPTSASAHPATDANPTHREDFMRLVDVAGRKPEPKD